MSAEVQGYCPACGGKSLFLGSGGYVTCSRIDCPNPTAASDILGEREIEHIVDLGDDTFSIQHPLRERLDGLLFECTVHERLSALDGPPRVPGKYRVYLSQDGATLGWHWERAS